MTKETDQLKIKPNEVRDDVEFGINVPVTGTAHETLGQLPGDIKQTFGLRVIEVVTRDGDTLGRALDAATRSSVAKARSRGSLLSTDEVNEILKPNRKTE